MQPCRQIPPFSPVWAAVDRVLARELRRAGTAGWDVEAARLLDSFRAAGWFPGAYLGQSGSCDAIEWRELACFAWWYARASYSDRHLAVQWLPAGRLPWTGTSPLAPCAPGRDEDSSCCPSFVYYDAAYGAHRAVLDQAAVTGSLPGIPEPAPVSYDSQPARAPSNAPSWLIAIGVFGGFLLALAGILHRGSRIDNLISAGN